MISLGFPFLLRGPTRWVLSIRSNPILEDSLGNIRLMTFIASLSVFSLAPSSGIPENFRQVLREYCSISSIRSVNNFVSFWSDLILGHEVFTYTVFDEGFLHYQIDNMFGAPLILGEVIKQGTKLGKLGVIQWCCWIIDGGVGGWALNSSPL